MLAELGTLLGVLNQPLNAMGVSMATNLQNYAAAASAAGQGNLAMSTVAFNIFAGPWIQYLGQMSIAIGNFMIGLETFLVGLKGLL